MAKGYRNFNGGNPGLKTGPYQVNSYDVRPTNVVAVATTGYTLNQEDLDNYNFFNAAQTSASTDLIILPSSTALCPVGTELWFFCVSACKVKAPASSGVGTNGGTDAQGITLAANSTYRFLRVSATNWICNAFSNAGAVTAPTAS
jgi:hypothetical protein